MSASKLPPVIEHPDGHRSVEISPGVNVSWFWQGKRCFLKVEGNQCQDFEVIERDETISWARQ
jgi:hypothetical protein